MSSEREHAIVILRTSKIVIRQSDSDQQRFPFRHRCTLTFAAQARPVFGRRLQGLVRPVDYAANLTATDTPAFAQRPTR